MEYNKLIRDKIPQIIKANGSTPITHTASQQEYQQKLKEKLQEEVEEFLENPTEEELADMLEVIYTLGNLYGIDQKATEKLRRNKQEKRGGFKNKIILEKVKE